MEAILSQLRHARQEISGPVRAQKLSKLLHDHRYDLHKQPEFTSARLDLQTGLCEALLQSLDPKQPRRTSSLNANKPSQPTAPCASQEQCGSTPPQSSQPIHSSQPNDTDTDASQQPSLNAENPISNNHEVADASAAPAEPTMAEAWLAAGPALQTIYTWEDEEIVSSVITFWSDVSNLLHGDWLQEEGQQASITSSRGQQQPDQLQQQQRYVQWMQQLGSAALTVMQLLYDFYVLTGISHLQHKQQTHLSRLLLLFLQLQPGISSSSGAATAAQQLLQVMHWPQHGSNSIAISTASALTASEAFTCVCQLLQTLPTANPAAEHDPAGHAISNSGDTQREQQAKAAAAFLQSSYGWIPLGMQSTNSSSSRRPEDTAYDCCMLELLHGMYNGPQTAAGSLEQQQHPGAVSHHGSQRGGKVSKQEKQQRKHWQDWCSSESFQALAHLMVAYDKPHLFARGLVALVLQQQQQQQLVSSMQGAGHEQGFVTSAAAGGFTVQKAHNEKAAMSKVMQLLESVYMQSTSDTGDKTTAASAVCKLMQGCAELLRPAANCTVEWRCAALSLMTTAVENFTAQHQDDGSLHSQLWCDDALEGLLYCLNHDASIKVRRTAMKLLQLVVLPSGSHAAVHLVKTLAAKVCDKDTTVGQAALELLVQLDAEVICSVLAASQWSAVVQAGLQLCSSPEEDGNNQALGKLSRQVRKQSASQAMCSDGQKQFLALLKSVLLFDAADNESISTAAPPGHGQEQLKQLHSMQGHQIGQWLMASANRVVGIGGCRIVLLLLLQNPELEMLCHAVADACT